VLRIRVVLGACALIGAPLALIVASATPAAAVTITVTTTADGGAGSLREAIETLAVNAGGDTVALQAGATYELTCAGGGDLSHGSTPLVLQGNGATIEQTCAGERVLDQGAAELDLFDVTITGGNTAGPGAGVRTSGRLSVLGSTISGNVSGPLAAGGGIATVGATTSVVVENSTITANTARNGGGIDVTEGSSVTVINSTITGNHADGGPGTGVGGGLESNGGGVWNFVYATIDANTANSAGANLSIGGGATIVVTQSVLANGGCSLNGNVVASTHSVTDATGSACGLTDATDNTVTDVLLATLGDYGGPTQTMIPRQGSPVLDVVPNAQCGAGQDGITTDQRGFDRPENAGETCDAGAVEGVLVPATPAPTTTTEPAAAAPAAAVPVAVAPPFTG